MPKDIGFGFKGEARLRGVTMLENPFS
jgi:hypothetical protein